MMTKLVLGGAMAACAVMVACCAAVAMVKPNALFSDNAVLQQGCAVPVWGTASDGEKVTVSLGKQVVSTIAVGGRWMVRLNPLKAGGPFTMTITGDNTVDVRNVMVGEVWIASGQSNMEWPLAMSTGGPEGAAASKDPMLRLLTVPDNPCPKPIGEVDVSWQECSPETSPSFSGIAYFFARNLRRSLKVPVGIIDASHGGTRIETWIPSRAVEDASELRRQARMFLPNEELVVQNRPSVNYNGMIAPLIPYAFKGALWYQGETNANLGVAFTYRGLLTTMIRTWRDDWGQGDFPFLVVQLPAAYKPSDEPKESAWAELREAQSLAVGDCARAAMVVCVEYGAEDLHPRDKEPFGARLELTAEAVGYGRRVAHQGPTYRSMRVAGDSIALSFENTSGGLTARGGEPSGFTIAGADHKFFNARAEIRGRSVLVRSDRVPRPVAVRYGWADWPAGNLVNGVGFPAAPFRTDGFRLLTQPK